MSSSTIPPAAQAAIEAKCQGIVSQRIAWQHATGKVLAAGCPLEELPKLVERLSSSRSLDSLASLSKRFQEPLGDFVFRLRQRVDETSFSWEDWLESIDKVLLLLMKQNRVAAPSVIAGFVHCTAEIVASQGMGQPLPEVVEEMLEQYGFEG